MPKYRLTLSYDGGDFVGWQVQPNGISIQGTIEEALSTLLKQPIRLIGSGRTDAGTHALAQVAHFTADAPCSQRALNGLLPHTIRILALEEVLETFHAQYSAAGKEYHYHLWLEPAVSPFVRRYRHHIPYPLDLDLMREAAERFVGTHDFATFANVGSRVKSTVRTIYRLEIVEQEGGVRLEFEGSGFLYKMVRNIVGTLIEVSTKKRPISDIERLFSAKDRRAAGKAAPAHGLFLVRVAYPKPENEATCTNPFSSSAAS